MRSQGWSLRKTTGDVYPLPDSATLQRWVVEGRVTRDDEIAEPGRAWVKAGSFKDLEPFFAVVDQAKRARTAPRATPLPGHDSPPDARTETGELVLGNPTPPASDAWEGPKPSRIHANEPAWAAGPETRSVGAPREKVRVAVRKRIEPKGRGWPVFFLFVVLIILGLATGATIVMWKPEWIPPDFSHLMKAWNTWTAGSEKSSQGGSSLASPESPSAASPQGAPTPPPKAFPRAAPQDSAAASSPNPTPPADGPSPSGANAPPAPAGAGESATPKSAETAPRSADTAPRSADTGAPAASAEPPPTAGAVPPAEPAKPPAERAKPPAVTATPAPPREDPAEVRAAGARARVEKKGIAETKPDPAAKSRALLAQASSLRERGRSSAALDAYARAIQANPNDAEALAGRGLAYLDLSRYREAEESFKGALDVNGSHPAALMGLAETYRYEGKRSDAVTYYRKYLAAHPKGEDATAARKAIQALEESP